MNRKQEEKAEHLALEHWTYIKELLDRSSFWNPYVVVEIGKHYREAMIHGYKHGIEDGKKNQGAK